MILSDALSRPEHSCRLAVRMAAVVTVALLSLTSCATPRVGAAPVSESPVPLSPSASPAEAFVTPTPLPSPADSFSPSVTVAPGQGSVTIITLEVRDGKVEASGIAPGMVESSGVCTLTLTRGSRSVDASTDAVGGRDSMYCGLLSVDVADMATGTWTAVITYTSATRTAESAPSPIDIP